MGSLIVNYYRRKDPTNLEEVVPEVSRTLASLSSYLNICEQADLGEGFMLEPTDESPFMKFGQVEPGQMVPTMYNNLVRAPLFRHVPNNTDFLVVKYASPLTRSETVLICLTRTTIDGEITYYLREIKNMFVVGQTLPVVEVPGPQSRKISTLTRDRLRIIIFKLVRASANGRIRLSKLVRFFPGFTELQMRQRLKVKNSGHNQMQYLNIL